MDHVSLDHDRWQRGESHFCLGCGKLPPHQGCSAICAACAPPNGTCDCAGCALVQPYRDRLEVFAEEARGLAGKHDMSQPGHVADLLSLAEFAEKGVSPTAPASRQEESR